MLFLRAVARRKLPLCWARGTRLALVLVALATDPVDANAQLVGAVDSGFLSGRVETILGRETILRSTGNYEFSPNSSALRFPAGFDVVPGAIGEPFETRTNRIERPGEANASGSGVNVSRGGECMVGYIDNGFFTPYHAFHWTESGGLSDLGTLDPPNNDTRSSFAHDVSSDCSVAVGFSSTSGVWDHAFRWTAATGMVDLGTGAGSGTDFGSRAFGVNADGTIIVGESAFPDRRSAFRWTESGGFASLGPDTVVANAVTADGSVVVGQGRVQAFRWTETGGAQFLGVLPGHTHSAATAVSDDGKIVVGFSGVSLAGQSHIGFSERRGVGGAIEIIDPAATRAFYWTEEAGMQDLTQLLVDAGADLNGITINAALGMSSDGEWIHGITTVPDPEFPDLFVDEVPVLMSLTYTPPGSLPGDYNGNGLVEQADLDLVLLNWGGDGTNPPAGWTSGLPSGSIDQAELDGVLLQWGNQAAETGSTSIPEPRSLSIVVLLVFLTLVRRYPLHPNMTAEGAKNAEKILSKSLDSSLRPPRTLRLKNNAFAGVAALTSDSSKPTSSRGLAARREVAR
jgi:probable HAF family extracellular repeat protein